MRGGAGNESLYGGGGNDSLQGEAGADVLTGGAGSDLFQYATLGASPATGHDTITDFSQSENDRINISFIDSDPATIGDQAFSFVAGEGSAFLGGGIASVRWYQSGGNTFVEADTGDGLADLVIMLIGSINLTPNDVVL